MRTGTPRAGGRRAPGIRLEVARQGRRLRTWLALAAMAGVPVAITLAFRFGSQPGKPGGETPLPFLFVTASGLNLAFAALTAMSQFLLVVAVALFPGDAVAGEASWGTLRYLLLRPVPRGRLLAAKLAAAALLGGACVAVVSLTGLAAGTIAFGWGPLITPLGTVPAGEALGRLALATAYVAWTMAPVVLAAFALSTVTDSPAGAIAGAVGLSVVLRILDAIPALDPLRNGLPTHWWDAWFGLLGPGGVPGDLVRGALVQVPWAVGFGAFAWWWFGRKDIVS